MPPISHEELVRMIHESTGSVFSTMLQLPAEPEPARKEAGNPAPVDGVIALVGIAGTWTGTGHIYVSPGFACKLAGALLSTEYQAVDGDVLDAVAEVANMIVGNIKTHLEAVLGPLGLGVPTVIYGRNYQARTSGAHEWLVAPFRCGAEHMEIRFCLMETRTSLRPATLRQEPALASTLT